MCTYLNKTGSTYYFRRPVPDDLQGYFATATGKPRTEWKISLRTKDRETAKRLLRAHEVDTDQMIDNARRTMLADAARTATEKDAKHQHESCDPITREATGGPATGSRTASDGGLSEWEQEERDAQAVLDAESRERRLARRELRTLWHQRRKTSTAMLEPEQAAAVDLIKERDARIEELQRAIAVMKAGNDDLGYLGRRLATLPPKPRPTSRSPPSTSATRDQGQRNRRPPTNGGTVCATSSSTSAMMMRER